MSIKKPLIIIVALLLISVTQVRAPSVQGINLPDEPVTLNAVNGTDSYFIITLSNVPAGFDVTNGMYPGWCIDRSVIMPRNTDFSAILNNSYDPLLPAAFQDSDWDIVNWIINNKDGYSMMEIQDAIWYLIDEYSWNLISGNARSLVAIANISGDGFIPQSGDIIAIVAVPLKPGFQCTFIELIIPPIPEICCRWTGGGTIGLNRNPRVTHGFELHCCVDQLPNNLEVNWGGNHFHLDVLTMVECYDDPAIAPKPPRAGCDTIHGWGDGKYNGATGYHVEFIFTDAGEPGKLDWAWILITDSNSGNVMEVSGFLKSGNQQAHRCTGIDAR